MPLNIDLIKKVRNHFNLNIYESKVWLALISKGIASAGEIAEISGVPRSRTYDVLESLEKQGFAISKIGKPVKYIAVKPTVVVENLKKNALKNADEKVKTLSKLKDTKEYEELETLHNSNIDIAKDEELRGAVKGKSNIYSNVREILENADKEVIICMSSKELNEKSRIFNGLFERLKKAGIDIRLILRGENKDIKKISNKYKLKPKKTEIKATFFIADRKQILFMVTNNAEENEDVGVWLNSDFFSSALADLLEISLKGK